MLANWQLLYISSKCGIKSLTNLASYMPVILRAKYLFKLALQAQSLAERRAFILRAKMRTCLELNPQAQSLVE